MRGNIELPTIQRGVRKVVKIKQGQVFLLPSRIPHSPQRPEKGSLGLVIERRREKHELDGLRFYEDFQSCDKILWEKYFHCYDLGRDLVPVIQEYKRSSEFATGRATGKYVATTPPTVVDTEIVVPEPFYMDAWIREHREQLESGRVLNLFEGHPDGEFKVLVAGRNDHEGVDKLVQQWWPHETWLYQMEGHTDDPAVLVVYSDDGKRISKEVRLAKGDCCVVPAKTRFVVRRPTRSLGLIVFNNPLANKKSSSRL